MNKNCRKAIAHLSSYKLSQQFPNWHTPLGFTLTHTSSGQHPRCSAHMQSRYILSALYSHMKTASVQRIRAHPVVKLLANPSLRI